MLILISTTYTQHVALQDSQHIMNYSGLLHLNESFMVSSEHFFGSTSFLQDGRLLETQMTYIVASQVNKYYTGIFVLYIVELNVISLEVLFLKVYVKNNLN